MKLQDSSLLREQAYVDGQWVGCPSLPVFDPATGSRIASVPSLQREDVKHAIRCAGAAFCSWSRLLAGERAGFLRLWIDLIRKNKEDLAFLITCEQGKPLSESRDEVDYGVSFLEFYAEEAKRLYGETIPPFRRSSRIVVTKEPLGVVAAITPWNFPMAMITRKIAPALAAGCTVVCKPAIETPLTALALVALAERAGIPPGVFNVVTGDAVQIGIELTANPLVKLIAFTGSTAVGKLLMNQSASSVKRLLLELGGNAPFIIFPDADIDSALSGVMFSKYRNMGQTCISSNRIYVHEDIYELFLERLSYEVSKLKVGSGGLEGVDQGPLISQSALIRLEQQIKSSVDQGAQIVKGGCRHSLGGTFFEPTVLRDVRDEMRIACEEIFGPVAPVLCFSDEADVIARANATRSGLAAYIYSCNLSRCWRMAEELEFGMVGINEGRLSTELAPFGGTKESGIGREGSRYGIEDYVNLKYMLFGGLSH
ncbi:MAG: NAD-dependent succinate-semialdehyde dehydrogenase [Alphaproteobacteria bacterium]|nr:NAD-dependent succinate-semialdehyde dehydrogenase [Alphaproteobacteria bacterium]